MWRVIEPPTPVDEGAAERAASKERLVHVGSAPDSVKPPSLETLTDEKLSVESEAAAIGRTVILKNTLSPGSIRLAVLPLLHAPLPWTRANEMESADMVLMHQPVGGCVDELKEYLAVSILKVIVRMLFDGPLLVTLTGIIASGSAMTTSAGESKEREKVSAIAAEEKIERKKKENDMIVTCLVMGSSTLPQRPLFWQ